MESEINLKIRDFAKRIISGEIMESLEDLQFYSNYKAEIEEVLKTWEED
tara:strand:+ start:6491 stop:6637 length:147 start_codon:yes stop_codon:yes gene_type:complete